MMAVLPLREPSELAGYLHEVAAKITGADGLPVPTPYGPEFDDLHHLYAHVRRTAAVSVMEIGSGWSTLVLALALHENAASFGDSYDVRHPNPFRLLSVDASAEYSRLSFERLPAELAAHVDAHVSSARLVEFDGRLASLFDELPMFVADLIYLDGPEPSQVSGVIDGLELTDPHGLPMSADLLRLEPMLWPGTHVIVDGRTANARFLAAHLRRDWQHLRDPYGERTTFFLDETPYGEISERHLAARRALSRALLRKPSKNTV
jgi:hypothetical protein